MELITTIPYEEVEFNFITNHYDVHLHGTCIYNGDLCEFYTHEHYSYEEDKMVETVSIYKLTFFEKMRWELKQMLFELCVGHHWSYVNGVAKGKYRERKPKWLYSLLFQIYYRKRF